MRVPHHKERNFPKLTGKSPSNLPKSSYGSPDGDSPQVGERERPRCVGQSTTSMRGCIIGGDMSLNFHACKVPCSARRSAGKTHSADKAASSAPDKSLTACVFRGDDRSRGAMSSPRARNCFSRRNQRIMPARGLPLSRF